MEEIRGLGYLEQVTFISFSLENMVRLRELHGEGILVDCWTCDDKAEAERLTEWGVDFLTTNCLE